MSVEMKTLTIGSTTYEIVDEKARNSISSIIDPALTQSGHAADAAVVGQKFSELSEKIANKPNADNQYNTLYMLSPNGTVYKVKISDAGELYVDGVASGDDTL